MSQDEYNQLPYDYAHCVGTHSEKTSQCLLTQPTRCSKSVRRSVYSLESVMHSFTVRNSYSFNEMIR